MITSRAGLSRGFVPVAIAAVGTLLLSLATNAAAQTTERVWTVACGLPLQNNPLLALMPTGGYTGPWPDGGSMGHLEAKTLNVGHPDGGISTEMWLLSNNVGWWKLKAIRVHPEDASKVTMDTVSNPGEHGIRQIVESPFLARPAVIRAGEVGEEGTVDGQILALLPDASQLRCAQQSEDEPGSRIARAQRALVEHGKNPGPVDGRMGPRTRAALRAFQTEEGLTAHGKLDDATFARLTAPPEPFGPE